MDNEEKKWSPVHSKGAGRKQQIKKCKNCGGKPTAKPFELDAGPNHKHVGEMCNVPECGLVISWEKVKKTKTEAE